MADAEGGFEHAPALEADIAKPVAEGEIGRSAGVGDILEEAVANRLRLRRQAATLAPRQEAA